jgi:hypothetical protein
MARIPKAGPTASGVNARSHPQLAAHTGTSRMVAGVERKPRHLCILGAVPTQAGGAISAVRAESYALSATTVIALGWRGRPGERPLLPALPSTEASCSGARSHPRARRAHKAAPPTVRRRRPRRGRGTPASQPPRPDLLEGSRRSPNAESLCRPTPRLSCERSKWNAPAKQARVRQTARSSVR